MKTSWFTVTLALVAVALIAQRCTSPSSSNSSITVTDSTKVIIDSTTVKHDTTSQHTAPATPAETTDTTKHSSIKDIAPLHKVLTLIVKNLKSSSAPVVVGVYGPDNKFLDTKDQMKEYRFTPNANTLTAKIVDLDYGKLAMALYQDINSDGKINKNFVGVPTEPYAFTNDYKPVIRGPKFKECAFTYDAGSNTVVVTMGN